MGVDRKPIEKVEHKFSSLLIHTVSTAQEDIFFSALDIVLQRALVLEKHHLGPEMLRRLLHGEAC